MLGLFDTDIHLFGIDPPNRLYPLGADGLGRDMMARILTGGQVSMTVGLVGVALTIFLGSVLGTISGYFGGLVDDVMQRIVEIIQSFPTIPLWAALAAALPNISETFTMLHRYFLITLILSLVNWTGLARQLRAKVMSYNSADFTSAALVAGASNARIIFVHMLPNAASHIIVVAALSIPGMILGETALSFLGLGILPPMVSWGALLRDAQQVAAVVQHPWLIYPRHWCCAHGAGLQCPGGRPARRRRSLFNLKAERETALWKHVKQFNQHKRPIPTSFYALRISIPTSTRS